MLSRLASLFFTLWLSAFLFAFLLALSRRTFVPVHVSAALASLLGDSDALPFALDVSSPGEEAPGRGGESGDAEIGAFVRALQDAPPLRNSESSLSCRTLSSAMLELRQLKEFVSFQS